MWARGYFCVRAGAVDEQTIKASIENQKWDEDDHGFKIAAPHRAFEAALQPRDASGGFSRTPTFSRIRIYRL